MIALAWIVATVALYVAARWLYARWPKPLLSPLVTAPAALAGLLALGHVPYRTYMRGGARLVDVLGPVMVAFAVPLWRHRDLLRRHAVELATGVATGCAVAVGTSVVLAHRLQLGREMTASLAPRSVTTPIAMVVASDLGGAPTLAAVFVIVTAVVGLVIGDVAVRRLPLRSPIARGALLGMGAHGAGTAQAMTLGAVEGTVAGLVMVLAGISILLAEPVIGVVVGR